MSTVGPLAERSRLDLTLETSEAGVPQLGLYGVDRRGVVDMKDCPMADERLNEALKYLRKFPLPKVKKGSLRLRVSPEGKWGLWIDFANVDIKSILDEKTWLKNLKDKFVIEVGQKNKRLIEKEGRYKLGDAEAFAWFETYLGAEFKPQKLYMPISGFTQTGFAANKLLVSESMKELEQKNITEVLELFCGSGNFTLAMASRNIQVTAIELDAFALDGLNRSLSEARLENNVRVLRKDLYRHSFKENSAKVWWVDPPRSGLKGVLKVLSEIEEKDRPERIVYVSCFLKSWSEDARRLISEGYRIESVKGVDQFPNTPHCEWITVFSR